MCSAATLRYSSRRRYDDANDFFSENVSILLSVQSHPPPLLYLHYAGHHGSERELYKFSGHDCSQKTHAADSLDFWRKLLSCCCSNAFDRPLPHATAATAVALFLLVLCLLKVWRTVLEGALLEARSGNTDVARKVLKYLMTHVPWYGPIYYEAFR